MTNPILGLRDIVAERAGRTILEVETLDVSRGELLAVVGPNGAGKSTLLQTMALLDRPTRGKVLLDGQPVEGNHLRHRRRMAVVFQEPLLLDTTVADNVNCGLALRGVRRPERENRVGEWLARFGIGHLAARSVRTLSGGEAQRTSLARALVLEPDILLLDEPFASLDTPTRESLMNDLDAILASSSTATIFVTHDRVEALRLGDRLAVLIGGRIRQIGTPEAIFTSPTDEEVAAFVGVETIIPGRICTVRDELAVVDVRTQLIEARWSGSAGVDVLVCIRPEDIVLVAEDEPTTSTSARNRMRATVKRILPSGPFVRVELDVGSAMVALITRASLEDLSLVPGSSVVASFKATAVHLIQRHGHTSREL